MDLKQKQLQKQKQNDMFWTARSVRGAKAKEEKQLFLRWFSLLQFIFLTGRPTEMNSSAIYQFELRRLTVTMLHKLFRNLCKTPNWRNSSTL